METYFKAPTYIYNYPALGMWRQLTVPVTALDGMQGYIMTSASY